MSALPLTETIAALDASFVDYNKNAPGNTDGDNAYANVTFGPWLDRLSNWDQPATSVAEAIAALEFAKREADDFYSSEPVGPMIKAALSFLRGIAEPGPHPDAKLIELGKQFERAKAEALSLEQQGKPVRKTFIAKHREVIRLMKAIHRAKATTLEGFAVKIAAVVFDQADFEVSDPVPTDVAERMLYRVARQMAKAAKQGGQRNG